ncbi:MAG: hypothetical protein EXQ52_04435 [Bryobacterales bacterium]|nr:hypothetical protein [Bryobacterales bacterium]
MLSKYLQAGERLNPDPAPRYPACVDWLAKRPPGNKWAYKTGETNLIGVLVNQAAGKSLGAHLSGNIGKPLAMEESAYWDRSGSGSEMGAVAYR